MAEGGRDPLEIFPAEIWEFILEELRKQGSSRDVLNCSKVCTEFERILEPTKQQWLFGSICPFILPYLKGGELLACRGVCKNWGRGVDNFLEDFETRRPFDEGTDISRSTDDCEFDLLWRKGIKWTHLKDKCELVNFLEGMKKQEMKIPFVGRSLSLGNYHGSFGRKWNEFLERALEVLSLYGDHISHLNILSAYESSQILNQILLGCTLNLKSLTFYNFKWPDTTDSSEFLDPQTDEIKKLLENHPLPEISCLEKLEIRATTFSSSTRPLVILERLFSQINFGNLKCLKLHQESLRNFNVERVPFAVVRPFQHLTELHVCGFQWDDFENICNNMISPTAPLAKIRWGFSNYVMSVDFDRVCTITNRWKRTLRMLAINGYMNDFYGEPGISLSKLDTPNLKTLELESLIVGPGFLPPVVTASLEYLHILFHNFVANPEREFYKSVFDAGKLHNSSIWGELKSLKKIRGVRPWSPSDSDYEKIVCTREMHERGIRAKFIKIGDDSNSNSDDDNDHDDYDDYEFDYYVNYDDDVYD